MNEMNEIKIPKGVESISVTQHDDKIVIEFIPEKPKFKQGDFVYEDGRIMIVKKYPYEIYALIYPKINMLVIYDDTYGINLSLSSLSFRYATEDEKQLLIYAMEKDGKQWNAEKLKIEDILKKGDLAIFWDDDKAYADIRLYGGKYHEYYCDNFGTHWKNAIKFEFKGQFEKLLRGEI
jgi:hypothetical protein